MNYTKQPLDFPQILQMLKDRGIIVRNANEALRRQRWASLQTGRNLVLFGCSCLVAQSHGPLCSFVSRWKHLKNNQALYYNPLAELKVYLAITWWIFYFCCTASCDYILPQMTQMAQICHRTGTHTGKCIWCGSTKEESMSSVKSVGLR